MQLIVTTELSEAENLWLKSLTNDLSKKSDTERLVFEYQEHKNNTLYKSVMDIIIRANREEFQEVKHMCSAWEELWHDELEEAKQKIKKTRPFELISLELEAEPDSIRDIYDMALAYPDMDEKEIYQYLYAGKKEPTI